jgi:predicted GIY-YIG superfamily endonuclease
MKYVCILESLDSGHFYSGITDDVRARLAKHNAGEAARAHFEIQTVAVEDLSRVQRREAGSRI